MSDPRARVLALLERHGWNATSFQVLEPGFRYWFDEGPPDACVAYVDTGQAWVAAGAPLAPAERVAEVAARFVAAARAQRRRACFFATEERFAHATDLRALPIGEQPVWDPALWPEALRRSPRLREQVRRARSKGVLVRRARVEEMQPGAPLRAHVENLITRWQSAHPMPPLGFLVQVHPFEFATRRRWYVAERDGQVVAFLGAVPVFARRGWLLEDLVRDPAAAPNGTVELLVDAAIRDCADEGCRWVTLGLSPLSGPVPIWLRSARIWGAGFFDFEGLRQFKAKLRPTGWDASYLCHPARVAGGALAIVDVLAAFARGGLLRFGLRTLARGPAVVIRLLALLLVPWTALLVLPAARPFFPSRAVQLAWVVLDAALAVALGALMRRWHDGWAAFVSWVVAADAVVTVAEATAYNLPRLTGWGAGAVTAIAVAAPWLGTFVLWGARRHRGRSEQRPG